VVLPASGCEMIAKVRRRKIWSVRVLINRVQLQSSSVRRAITPQRHDWEYKRSAGSLPAAVDAPSSPQDRIFHIKSGIDDLLLLLPPESPRSVVITSYAKLVHPPHEAFLSCMRFFCLAVPRLI
jgi:hypothetical protein